MRLISHIAKSDEKTDQEWKRPGHQTHPPVDVESLVNIEGCDELCVTETVVDEHHENKPGSGHIDANVALPSTCQWYYILRSQKSAKIDGYEQPASHTGERRKVAGVT